MNINKITSETCSVFYQYGQKTNDKDIFSSWIFISDGINTLILKSGRCDYEYGSRNHTNKNYLHPFSLLKDNLDIIINGLRDILIKTEGNVIIVFKTIKISNNNSEILEYLNFKIKNLKLLKNCELNIINNEKFLIKNSSLNNCVVNNSKILNSKITNLTMKDSSIANSTIENDKQLEIFNFQISNSLNIFNISGNNSIIEKSSLINNVTTTAKDLEKPNKILNSKITNLVMIDSFIANSTIENDKQLEIFNFQISNSLNIFNISGNNSIIEKSSLIKNVTTIVKDSRELNKILNSKITNLVMIDSFIANSTIVNDEQLEISNFQIFNSPDISNLSGRNTIVEKSLLINNVTTVTNDLENLNKIVNSKITNLKIIDSFVINANIVNDEQLAIKNFEISNSPNISNISGNNTIIEKSLLINNVTTVTNDLENLNKIVNSKITNLKIIDSFVINANIVNDEQLAIKNFEISNSPNISNISGNNTIIEKSLLINNVTTTAENFENPNKILNSKITNLVIKDSFIDNSTIINDNQLEISNFQIINSPIITNIFGSKSKIISSSLLINKGLFEIRDSQLLNIKKWEIHNNQNMKDNSKIINQSSINNLKNYILINGTIIIEKSKIDSESIIFFNNLNEEIIIKNSFLTKDVSVFNNANINNAILKSNASIFGNTKIIMETQNNKGEISLKSEISGYVKIFQKAKIYDSPKISGFTNIYGESEISDQPLIYGKINILDDARVSGKAEISKDIIINKYEEYYS